MALAVVKDEPAPPSAGHNNTELTEGEKRALLINGLGKIEALIEEKDEIVSDIRTERKRLVSHGFAPKVIDFALRIRKDEDDAMVEQRRAEMEVARFLNHPIGTQADIFDQPDRTPEVDKGLRARRDRRRRGKDMQRALRRRQPNRAGMDQRLGPRSGLHRQRVQKAGGEGGRRARRRRRRCRASRGLIMLVAGFDIATTTGMAVLDGTRVVHAEAYRPPGKTEAEIFPRIPRVVSLNAGRA
jgi:uncharacterized protein (UPF0335 family)